MFDLVEIQINFEQETWKHISLFERVFLQEYSDTVEITAEGVTLVYRPVILMVVLAVIERVGEGKI